MTVHSGTALEGALWICTLRPSCAQISDVVSCEFYNGKLLTAVSVPRQSKKQVSAVLNFVCLTHAHSAAASPTPATDV